MDGRVFGCKDRHTPQETFGPPPELTVFYKGWVGGGRGGICRGNGELIQKGEREFVTCKGFSWVFELFMRHPCQTSGYMR